MKLNWLKISQLKARKVNSVGVDNTVVAIHTVSLKDILYTKISINSPEKISKVLNICLINKTINRFKIFILFW